MNTQTGVELGFNLKNIWSLLTAKKTEVEYEPGNDIFYRHIRVKNRKTGEFYHNRGATVLTDLRAAQGRFFFSYSICNHHDTFNKNIAHKVCLEKMANGDVIEVINYDPEISILQNIYLAIGVQNDDYSINDFDWTYILPEIFGVFTESQKDGLRKLRKLIKAKS